MNINEINDRLAAINNRNKEIVTKIEKNQELRNKKQDVEEDYNLDNLNLEVENLRNEKIELLEKRTKIISSTDFENENMNPISQRKEAEIIVNNSPEASTEYRKSFMKFILTGKQDETLKSVNRSAIVITRLGNQARADEGTKTTDVQSVIIPTSITERLFDRNTQAGTLFNRVRKTRYQFGVEVKISAANFELTWVAESAAAESKKGTTDKISFKAFKGQINFRQSLESRIMTLNEFEAAMVQRIQVGIALSFDKVIISGDGTNQPKGILKDARYTGTGAKVQAFNNRTISEYQAWLGFISKIPASKRGSSVLLINQSDFYQYIWGIKDEAGNSICAQSAVINAQPKNYILGLEVVLLENQGLKTFDSITGATPSETTTFAVIVDIDNDYWLNLNQDITYREFIDNDTDDYVKRFTVICDGKMVDTSSIVVATRGVDVASTSKSGKVDLAKSDKSDESSANNSTSLITTN